MINRIFGTLFITAVGLFGVWQIYSQTQAMADGKLLDMNISTETQTAIFAGGCFWCTESDFEKVPGVVAVISGYTGGHVDKPTYHQVSSGNTGHVEAIKVLYDPSIVTYNMLLDYFWRHVDPTDGGGQFVDRGPQYRSVIFYATEEERLAIERSKEKLTASGQLDGPVVTDILPQKMFYPAEKYHQDYYKKNPLRYKFYRSRSGRDQFLEKTWQKSPDNKSSAMNSNRSQISNHPATEVTDMAKTGKISPTDKTEKKRYMRPGDGILKQQLTPLQFNVVRENATEPPFNNAFWDNHKEGIYVDVVSNEPLFSSKDKFRKLAKFYKGT